MEEFLPVSTTELKTIILSTNNKNCLLDPAPVKSMRQCLQVIFPLIQFIIKKESHVSCQLKQATITPIIKEKDLDLRKNYRPISNMTFMSKVLRRQLLIKSVNMFKEMTYLVQINQDINNITPVIVVVIV